MDYKTYEGKKKLLKIIAVVLQAITFITLFVGGAISRTGIQSSMIFQGRGSSKTVDFSICGLSNTRWDLGGTPQIKYGGAQFWFYLLLILTLASIGYIVYELVTKKSIIPEKISALVIAGIELYAAIFVIVLGNMSFKQIHRGESLFLTSTKRTIETHLEGIGIVFILLCLCIIGIKVYEFIITLKHEKETTEAVEKMESTEETDEKINDAEGKTDDPVEETDEKTDEAKEETTVDATGEENNNQE